ncbi:unnamed protein product [Staurois parvus]|uniref:Uncharacterized protein n=1 Tax=Staurois parvus TaxID=386267 RepID=A0ABN9DZQ1_9NEOB|nr:unnamed protein product [Staurois parvus]
MARDCGHSTGDDQRLQTVKGMTKRLRTFGEGPGAHTKDAGAGRLYSAGPRNR